MRKFLTLLLTFVSFAIGGFAQNNLCNGADPFCTNLTYNFPLGVNQPSAQAGADYGCLNTQPNPVWYYLQILQSGNISIDIHTSPSHDVDFVCWGPFSDQITPCVSLLTGGSYTPTHSVAGPSSDYPSANMIDCSYDAQSQEYCYIPNAISGQYYLLLLTNYSNQACNVIFNQIPSGNAPGDGTTNCNNVVCNFDNISLTINPCNPQTNQYSITGDLIYHFTGGVVTTGSLTIVDQPSGLSQTFYPPFTSPDTYVINGLVSDGLQHTLTATFSDAQACNFTITYTAPSGCNQCTANAGGNITVCGLTANLNAIEQTSDINTHWISQPNLSFSNINLPTSSVTTTVAGPYDIVWQITNSSGLTCYDTIHVIFNSIPTADFTIGSPICAGLTTTATYTGVGGNSFVWNFGTGTPSSANTQGSHIITYTSGPQTASLYVTALNGCVSDTVTHTVVVNPLPNSNFSAVSPVCVNDPSSIVYTGGSPNITNYAWSFNPNPTTLPGNQPGPFTAIWNIITTANITLVVTDANGCTSTPTIQQVQVLAATTPLCCLPPTPNAGVDASVCGLCYALNGSVPGPGNTGNWTPISGPGTPTFANVTSNNSNVCVTIPGTYCFQWNEYSGACDSSDIVCITFTAQPLANAGLKTQVCGLDMQLNATPSIGLGLWSTVPAGMATFTPNANAYNATAHVITYGDYYFVWTETNGTCSSSDTVLKSFLEIPIVNAGTDIIACGQNSSLLADSLYPGYWTSVPATAIYTPDATDPNASIWIPSYNQSFINYTFTWHAFNGICPGSDNVLVTFMKPPHAEAGLPQSVCGYTATLHADTIGSGIVNAYWEPIPGITITNGPVGSTLPYEPTVNASGYPNFWGSTSSHTIYFHWIATNGQNCTSEDSTAVTFYETPVANGGSDDSVCGKLYQFEGQWSINNHSGIWSTLSAPVNGTANFIPANQPDGSVTVSQYGTYVFIWKEMNAGNTSCYSRDTITIEFKIIPTPDAGLDFSVCGLCAYICATPSFPGGQWSCPGGGIAYYDTCGGTYNLNYRDSSCTWVRYPSQNQMVTMYWSEFNEECYGYDSVNVYFGSIEPAITLVSPDDSVVCGPVYTLLNAQSPAYGTGYWYDTVMNTSFTPSETVTNPTATIDTGSDDYYGYHCFHWVTVNGACRDTSPCVPVKYIKIPEANAGGNYWPGLFGANHNYKTDTVCGLSYQMGAIPSIGTGTWYGLNTLAHFNYSGNNITPIYNDSLHMGGGYSVFNTTGDQFIEFAWQENNEQCVNSDTLRLYFAPYPSGSFTTTIPDCRHDSSEIIAHTWNLPNNIDYGIVSYDWTFTNGELSSTIVDASISDTIYVSWPLGEQHNINLITTNMWGCSSGIVTHTVVEPPMFNPSYLVDETTCMDTNGVITLSTANGSNPNFYTFVWLPNQGIINTVATTQTGLSPMTTYYVQVNGQSLSPDAAPGTFCHDTLSIYVPDTGEVIAQFVTTTFEQMEPAPYTVSLVNSSINARKYSWRFYDEQGNLVGTSTLENPSFTFLDEGCYQIVLVATSKQGCTDTMSFYPLCVDATPVFDIPNVFTPNGDGQNDIFRVHGKSIVEFQAYLFNRWGQKIYEWNDINGGWNGKIGSAEASPGTYYYKIIATDKNDKKYDVNGFFYLLKEK